MRTETYRSPWWDCHGYIACTVKFSDGFSTTIFQHREVMEAHFGRELRSDEIVHHKDENKSNNALENLEVLSRAEHARLHAREPEIQRFVCPECSNTFDKLMRYHRKNQMKKGAAGPFCGRRCSGRYNQRKRN